MTQGPIVTDFLARSDGEQIAVCHIKGSAPGVLFLPGFNSDMRGTKSQALAAWCQQRGIAFTALDYFGHGESSGELKHGSMGRWLDDAVAVLDDVCEGPQLVVGSSMGGWLMLLLALARPKRVSGLVGIAAAPDFTQRLFEQRLSADQRASLGQTGYCELPNHYDDGVPHTIGRQLIEEGREHLLLGGSINYTGPVRLLHGQQDEDVPWQLSVEVAQRLQSRDVELILVKDGDHRLSSGKCIARLTAVVGSMLGV